jgi:hypothetical protein
MIAFIYRCPLSKRLLSVESKMPDLPLSRAAANDIAAYITTLK